MNARGIPTAAYQVLHMLSCPGGGGGRYLGLRGRGRYLGVPSPLNLAGGGGVRYVTMAGGGTLGYPLPHQGLAWRVGTLAGGGGGGLSTLGYPPSGPGWGVGTLGDPPLGPGQGIRYLGRGVRYLG